MHVDDLAEACVYFLNKKTKETLINVGSGDERSIRQYVSFLKKKMNYDGTILFDKSKPNGTPRKVVDSSIAKKYGWKSKISLTKGFKNTLENFIKNYKLNFIETLLPIRSLQNFWEKRERERERIAVFAVNQSVKPS